MDVWCMSRDGEMRKCASYCWVFKGSGLYYFPLGLEDTLEDIHLHNELLYEERQQICPYFYELSLRTQLLKVDQRSSVLWHMEPFGRVCRSLLTVRNFSGV